MMPRPQNLFVWLLTAAVAVSFAASPANAQDQKPAENEEKAEETPWPPPNTEKVELKADESQKTGLVLYPPKSWKQSEPSSKLRLGQFEIPAEEGDKQPVELAIFSFGGGAGGIQANVQRWIDQFQPEGRKQQITTADGKQGPYVLVDLQGTYNMPDGPPILQKTKPLPDARMLAAIQVIRWEQEEEADGEKKTVEKAALYFLKMAGPEKTVSANEKAFRQAFGAAPKSKEKSIEERPEDSNR